MCKKMPFSYMNFNTIFFLAHSALALAPCWQILAAPLSLA